MLRHTYTSNLLSNGAAPKDVQELLGHGDVSTTMNIYAHAAREAKLTSARPLDKVVCEELYLHTKIIWYCNKYLCLFFDFYVPMT